MSQMVFIQQWREYVAAGELDKLSQELNQVLTLSDSDWLNEALLLSARWRKWQSDTRKNLLLPIDGNVLFAQIVNSYIELINELADAPEAFEGYQQLDFTFEQSIQARHARTNFTLKKALYNRLTQYRQQVRKHTLIWVDNHPENNALEINLLKQIGLDVVTCATSEEALQALAERHFEVMLSDVSRGTNHQEGIHFLQSNHEICPPVIFYNGYNPPGQTAPPYAFAIAHKPDDMLHYVLDVLDRLEA